MLIVILVVPPFEGNLILFNTNDALIGYSDSVRISAQVLNNTSSIFKRWLAINNPLFVIERGEQFFKFPIIGKIGLTAVEFRNYSGMQNFSLERDLNRKIVLDSTL
jgi:hypothetical protein